MQNLLVKTDTEIFGFVMELIYKIMHSSVQNCSRRSHFTVLGTLSLLLKNLNTLPESSILLHQKPSDN